MLPFGGNPLPFLLCCVLSCPLASLRSVPSLHWGPSICLPTFCAVFVAKSSAKVDRLTVTSVSELETDSRLVFYCFGLVLLSQLTTATLQTSNSNPTHRRSRESIGFATSEVKHLFDHLLGPFYLLELTRYLQKVLTFLILLRCSLIV